MIIVLTSFIDILQPSIMQYPDMLNSGIAIIRLATICWMLFVIVAPHLSTVVQAEEMNRKIVMNRINLLMLYLHLLGWFLGQVLPRSGLDRFQPAGAD
jgi:hypothetical protein